MANYSNVDGVRVQEWGPDSEPGEPNKEWTGEIEEMYFDHGSLTITITNPNDETLTDVRVPVKAKDSWNEFVDSLPQW